MKALFVAFALLSTPAFAAQPTFEATRFGPPAETVTDFFEVGTTLVKSHRPTVQDDLRVKLKVFNRMNTPETDEERSEATDEEEFVTPSQQAINDAVAECLKILDAKICGDAAELATQTSFETVSQEDLDTIMKAQTILEPVEAAN